MTERREGSARPVPPERRSTRLRGFDYKQAGAYFVTICTRNRACLFGEVVDEAVRLSPNGAIVQSIWQEIPRNHAGVSVDEFVVMPNHLHGVLLFAGVPDGAALDADLGAIDRSPTLGQVVRAFKSRVTCALGTPIWQRNYYDHVVRDDDALSRVRQYIRDNPLMWDLDCENPAVVGPGQQTNR